MNRNLTMNKISMTTNTVKNNMYLFSPRFSKINKLFNIFLLLLFLFLSYHLAYTPVYIVHTQPVPS